MQTEGLPKSPERRVSSLRIFNQTFYGHQSVQLLLRYSAGGFKDSGKVANVSERLLASLAESN